MLFISTGNKNPGKIFAFLINKCFPTDVDHPLVFFPGINTWFEK